ncbi:hypothetical protein KQI84_07940 [bacterium]|nr:hypothetical protein [bacterium]
MDKIAAAVLPFIQQRGYPHRIENGQLIVILPSNFGELLIGDAPPDDTMIGLVGYAWHTHGDIEEELSGLPMAEAIAQRVDRIFAGKDLMVEETDPNGKVDRVILDSRFESMDPKETLSKALEGYTARVFPART